jgi:hypothetical protein
MVLKELLVTVTEEVAVVREWVEDLKGDGVKDSLKVINEESL